MAISIGYVKNLTILEQLEGILMVHNEDCKVESGGQPLISA
jgi:hypothetical protein